MIIIAQKNTTAFIVLGLLAHEDSSGYDLKKKIDRMISMFWDVGYGQLYPTLKTLEAEGSVKSSRGSSGKGPDRIVYSISEKGRKKLSEWLSTPGEKEVLRYEILLKLFFGSLNSPEENLKKIESFQDQQAANLNMIKLFKANLEKVLDEGSDHMYYYLTVLFGEHIYKAYLDWAAEASQIIKEHRMPRKDELDETPKNS